jgi:hypothetical protein
MKRMQDRWQQSVAAAIDRKQPQAARQRAKKPMNSRARARFVAVLIPILASACGGRNSEREEARELLTRISKLDLNASFEQRGQQIEALRGVKLSVPALHEARERCLQAHAGLLAAERQQADSRARIDRAEADGRRDRAELAAIAAGLADAARALQHAHRALPECEQRARELALVR